MFSLKTILIVATAALTGVAFAAPIAEVAANAADMHARSPGVVAIDAVVDALGLVDADVDLHVRSPELANIEAVVNELLGSLDDLQVRSPGLVDIDAVVDALGLVDADVDLHVRSPGPAGSDFGSMLD